MDRETFSYYLEQSRHCGKIAADAARGTAGSALCGDEIEVGLIVEPSGVVRSMRYVVNGCGATKAAAEACAELVSGSCLPEVAKLSSGSITRQLGGLSQLKAHAADLVADALHAAISNLWAAVSVALNPNPKRVLVAMSGGVDSTVAAQLALERGDEVVGVTLKLWSDPATDGSKACCSPEAVLGARALAHRMGIPHFTLDLRSVFRAQVVSDYVSEHSDGRTPNPCVRCNGMVRFAEMLELRERLGARRLLTGHYARIVRDANGPLLAAASDPDKDQSYMLCALDPKCLNQLEFPLAELRKQQVRWLAAAAELPVAEKPDSQDLCFLAGSSKGNFLARHGTVAATQGPIVDLSGGRVGTHSGYQNYTVGQRKGLGISASEPMYVIATDPTCNSVVVGPKSALSAQKVRVSSAVLYRPADGIDSVKLRYRQRPIECRVGKGPAVGTGRELVAELNTPTEGISPGQTACFFERDRVVGWGVVESAEVDRSTLQDELHSSRAA